MAGSIESPVFANSLPLRLPARRLRGLWDVLGPTPGAPPRIPTGTTVLLFLVDSAVLSSLSSAGVTCKVETALIKANSSCFSIAAAGALPPLSKKRFAAHSSHTMKMSSALSLSLICPLSICRSDQYLSRKSEKKNQDSLWPSGVTFISIPEFLV